MSTEQNKAVLRRWMEAWSTRSVSVLETLADDVFTADFVVHDSAQPAATVGREGVKQFVRDTLKNTLDIHVALEDMIAEGDRVATRLTVTGIEASTARPVNLLVMDIYRFAGAKITEAWGFEGSPVSGASNSVAVVNALDAACNAGDIERVMALFTDDAILKDPVGSKLHTGKQRIREWFRPQMGHFHVTSTNHRVASNTVTWHSALTGDAIREMGSNIIEETAEAVVQDSKITSFALTIVAPKP